MDKLIAKINLKTIQKNLEKIVNHYEKNFLKIQSKNFLGAVPMVKCNAYGHGLTEVSKSLEELSSTYALGVATVDEAIELRKAKIKKPIWIFSRLGSPIEKSFLNFALEQNFSIVVYTLEDLKKIIKYQVPVKIHLKFNTGMNRLGIEKEELSVVRNLLLINKNVFLEGICTHFAYASNPKNVLTKKQVEIFKYLVDRLSAFNFSTVHCANTAAVIEDEKLKTSSFCNLIRPGIGIYGYSSDEKNILKLKPALELFVRTLLNRKLKYNESIGYDFTYTTKKKTTYESVLAIGYGDGFHRTLSNKRILVRLLHESRIINTRVLGIVSMDTSMLELKTKAGSWVQVLGYNENQAKFMAKSASTNVYEILTSLSATRVKREY
jgi:alanine racemase